MNHGNYISYINFICNNINVHNISFIGKSYVYRVRKIGGVKYDIF